MRLVLQSTRHDITRMGEQMKIVASLDEALRRL
jgi:hypothetical protein